MKSLYFILISMLLLSCKSQPDVGIVSAPEDPSEFFRAGAGDDPVIARVGDWTITGNDLAQAHPVRPGATVEESLDTLVERMLVVRAALGEGGLQPRFDALLAWRQALAFEWLGQRFTRDFTAEDVSDEIWKQVYKKTLPKFDHMDTFFVLDAQLICCYDSVHNCNKAQVAQCQDDNEQVMDALRATLAENQVTTAEQFRTWVDDFKNRHDGRVALGEYNFQYNIHVPHSEQRGYFIYNENISRTTMQMQPGEISPVIRSNHGLHVIFLHKHFPEVHRAFDSPGVKEELAEMYMPMLREAEAVRQLNLLVGESGIRLFKELLAQVDWARVTGLK